MSTEFRGGPRTRPGPGRGLAALAERPDTRAASGRGGRRRSRAGMRRSGNCTDCSRARSGPVPHVGWPTPPRSRLRCMERSKAAFLMAIDGARAACAVLGTDLAAAGLLRGPADSVFLTADELAGTMPLDPRRARRVSGGPAWLEYRSLTLPTTFRRDAGADSAALPPRNGPAVLRGAAGLRRNRHRSCPGDRRSR